MICCYTLMVELVSKQAFLYDLNNTRNGIIQYNDSILNLILKFSNKCNDVFECDLQSLSDPCKHVLSHGLISHQ